MFVVATYDFPKSKIANIVSHNQESTSIIVLVSNLSGRRWRRGKECRTAGSARARAIPVSLFTKVDWSTSVWRKDHSADFICSWSPLITCNHQEDSIGKKSKSSRLSPTPWRTILCSKAIKSSHMNAACLFRKWSITVLSTFCLSRVQSPYSNLFKVLTNRTILNLLLPLQTEGMVNIFCRSESVTLHLSDKSAERTKYKLISWDNCYARFSTIPD